MTDQAGLLYKRNNSMGTSCSRRVCHGLPRNGRAWQLAPTFITDWIATFLLIPVFDLQNKPDQAQQ